MLVASIPVKFSIPWANSAGITYINAIPTASQIGITAGAASLTDGFPPTTMQTGGTPPAGPDFNGILKWVTQWGQWQAAGGPVAYDSTFQTAVSGYPLGAVVASATTFGVSWMSTVDANATNPDIGGAGWVKIMGQGPYYAPDTGSANALVISVPAISALAVGQLFVIKKSSAANTAATTINVNGLGAQSLVWADTTPLIAGDWPAGVTALAEYDGGQFNLISVMGPSVFARKSMALMVTPQTTFYVNASTGNDTNPGTAAQPFLTAAAAVNYISRFYSSGAVTVNFAAGTYAGFTVPPSPISDWIFVGAGTGSCNISSPSLAVNTGYGVESFATMSITGFSISAYNAGILANSGGSISVYGCNFTGIGSSSIAFSALNGGVINIFGASPGTASYTIGGTFNSIFNALSAGQIYVGTYNGSAFNAAFTFGTTTVSGAIAVAAQGAAIIFSIGYVSWAGSTPAGQRYFAALAAGITATGGGASFIPGSVAGTVSSTTYGYYQG